MSARAHERMVPPRLSQKLNGPKGEQSSLRARGDRCDPSGESLTPKLSQFRGGSGPSSPWPESEPLGFCGFPDHSRARGCAAHLGLLLAGVPSPSGESVAAARCFWHPFAANCPHCSPTATVPLTRTCSPASAINRLSASRTLRALPDATSCSAARISRRQTSSRLAVAAAGPLAREPRLEVACRISGPLAREPRLEVACRISGCVTWPAAPDSCAAMISPRLSLTPPAASSCRYAPRSASAAVARRDGRPAQPAPAPPRPRLATASATSIMLLRRVLFSSAARLAALYGSASRTDRVAQPAGISSHTHRHVRARPALQHSAADREHVSHGGDCVGRKSSLSVGTAIKQLGQVLGPRGDAEQRLGAARHREQQARRGAVRVEVSPDTRQNETGGCQGAETLGSDEGSREQAGDQPAEVAFEGLAQASQEGASSGRVEDAAYGSGLALAILVSGCGINHRDHGACGDVQVAPRIAHERGLVPPRAMIIRTRKDAPYKGHLARAHRRWAAASRDWRVAKPVK
eukprot:scaffold32520_cov108-Isochrysis_galbana.AAC.3